MKRQSFWNRMKAQPAAPRIQSAEKIVQMFTHWRARSLYAAFIGYAVYYFCRKNLSAATPGMIADLGYSKTSIGWIWSLMYLTYGISKLFNGVLGDRANPRYFMAIGLFLSAITNVLFGFSHSLMMLGAMWALNGWFQAMGGPASARIMANWFSPNELGTKWGIWNISHQVGGGVILVLGGYLTQHYGWRSAFFIPAGVAVLGGLFLINRLRDTPESLGLPPVEEYRNDTTREKVEALDSKHPVKDILFGHILKNREIWFLSLANFFVYIVRYGAMDWAPTFLVEVKHSSIVNASFKTSAIEFLGIAGSMVAGWASDKYFPGRRWILNVTYMVLLAASVVGFWLLPGGHSVLEGVLLGAVGFLVYGPQMLVGVCAADAAGKHAASTANGMTGFFGYMGSIVSGVGTGWMVEHYGWSGGFTLLIGSALIGAVLFLGTRHTTHGQANKAQVRTSSQRRKSAVGA